MTRRRKGSGDEQVEAERRKVLELAAAQFRSDLLLLLKLEPFTRTLARITDEFGVFDSECHENVQRQYFRDGQKSVGTWLLNEVRTAQAPPAVEPKKPEVDAETPEEENDGT
jgi:hypothetical protein